MIKRTLAKFPIHLGIFMILGLAAYFVNTKVDSIWGIAIIMFGAPIVSAFYHWEPWKKEEKKFPVVNFIIHATLLLVALFMAVGPASILYHTKAQLNDLKTYHLSSDFDGFMQDSLAEFTGYQGVFTPQKAVNFVTDTNNRVHIGYKVMYEDSSNMVLAVFAAEPDKKEHTTGLFLKEISKEKESLLLLADKNTRNLISKELGDDKQLQFVQWQGKEEVIGMLEKGVYNKLFVSFAFILILAWIDQRRYQVKA